MSDKSRTRFSPYVATWEHPLLPRNATALLRSPARTSALGRLTTCASATGRGPKRSGVDDVTPRALGSNRLVTRLMYQAPLESVAAKSAGRRSEPRTTEPSDRETHREKGRSLAAPGTQACCSSTNRS